MNAMYLRFVAVATAGAALLCAGDARAFRLIQNSSPGRTSFGNKVSCSDPLGFVHWTKSSLEWRLNTANQGSATGVTTALQNALAAWTAVSPASYDLAYAGTTNGGFQTDGVNTVLWASGNGCTGGCLAITALVLSSGQVINEADVSFNNDYVWHTNGSDYDVQAIATHELGHCLGIHHTEITKPRNRPTMYTAYFGLEGRTLESDDRDALNCSYSRYAPANLVEDPASSTGDGTEQPVAGAGLKARPGEGHATLRFALAKPGDVRLEVFDVAGRRVATLVDGVRGAGEHEVAWFGDTRSGPARQGVYFARVETPEGRATTTLFIGR